MPARKKRYGRKKRYTRRFKRGGLATKSFVRKQIHKDDETKYFETSTVAQAIDFNGVTTDLTNIPQGQTDGTRIGDKIRLRGIRLQFILNIADTTQNVRIMIVQYKGNTQIAATSISQVLVPTTLGTVNAPIANRVWDMTNQFSILYDKLYTLTNVSTPIIHVRKKVGIKYAKREINFYQALTTGSNKIYLMMVSDSGAAPHPTIQYQMRVMYDDA